MKVKSLLATSKFAHFLQNCTAFYLDVEKIYRRCYKYLFVLLSEDGSNVEEENLLKRYCCALENTIFNSPELWLCPGDR